MSTCEGGYGGGTLGYKVGKFFACELGIPIETLVFVFIGMAALGVIVVLVILFREFSKTYNLRRTNKQKFNERLSHYLLQVVIIFEILLLLSLLIGDFRDNVLGGTSGVWFWFVGIVLLGAEIVRRKIRKILKMTNSNQ